MKQRRRKGVPLRLVICRALPVDEVAQAPGILVQLNLQFAVFVDGELAGGIQNASALALVLVIQLKFAGGQVETLRLRVRIGFTEGDLAIGDETNRTARR